MKEEKWLEWLCWYSENDINDSHGKYRDVRYVFSEHPDFPVVSLEDAIKYLEHRAYPGRKLVWFRAKKDAVPEDFIKVELT